MRSLAIDYKGGKDQEISNLYKQGLINETMIRKKHQNMSNSYKDLLCVFLSYLICWKLAVRYQFFDRNHEYKNYYLFSNQFCFLCL